MKTLHQRHTDEPRDYYRDYPRLIGAALLIVLGVTGLVTVLALAPNGNTGAPTFRVTR
jgi:hypothetical protein